MLAALTYKLGRTLSSVEAPLSGQRTITCIFRRQFTLHHSPDNGKRGLLTVRQVLRDGSCAECKEDIELNWNSSFLRRIRTGININLTGIG